MSARQRGLFIGAGAATAPTMPPPGNVLDPFRSGQSVSGSVVPCKPVADRVEQLRIATGLVRSGRFLESITWLDTAIAQCQEDLLAAVCARATAIAELGNCEEALRTLDEVLAARPEYMSARLARGGIRALDGQHEAAIDDFEAVIGNAGGSLAEKKDPEQIASAHLGRGLSLLALGRIRDGLESLERGPPSSMPVPATPRWDGRSRPGTILVLGSGNIADDLIFLRYVPALAGLASKIILAVPPELRTLAECLRIENFSVTSEGSPRHDCWIALSSLPFALRDFLEPPMPPAFFVLPPALRDVWCLPMRADRLKVGLAWNGDSVRSSIPLALLEALTLIGGSDFYALQQPTAETDRPAFDRMDVYDIAGKTQDLRALACVISGLDLVIAVDSPVAVLAATLGVETLVLLPRRRLGRFWTEEGTSPWLPAATGFRQETDGDWTAPLARIRSYLEKRNAKCPTTS